MTLDQAHEIANALMDAGLDVEVRESYSGRAMYGETVPALVLDDDRALIALGWVACDLDIDLDQLPTRTDSMGRGIVVY